jgi:preprotein translocase subunit SecD
MNRINYRIVIFAIALIGAVIFSMPSFLQTSSGKKISLGLDLQGGLHMLLGVQTEQAVISKIKSIASSVKYFTDDSSILIEELIIDDYSFGFLLLDSDEVGNIETMLGGIAGLKFTKDNDLRYKVSIDDIEQKNIKDKAVSQVVETIRNRLDQFGLAEPSVTRQGLTDIAVGLPGIKSAEEEQRARELIAKSAQLEMMTVDEKRADQVYTISATDVKKHGDVILPSSRDNTTKYLLKAVPLLTGSQITDASVAFDQNNQPIITTCNTQRPLHLWNILTTAWQLKKLEF